MKASNTISLGRKIGQIRNYMSISQKKLASDLKCSIATISRIENDQINCDSKMLKAIISSLGIEGAPLNKGRDAAFREQLYVWRKVIKDRRVNEARQMQEGLSVILNLPFEQDLIATYRLFEINLLIAEKKLTLAEEKLSYFDSFAESLSVENLYHYYFNKGSLHMHQKQTEIALAYSLIALAYSLNSNELDIHNFEEEAYLYYNIAVCYSQLGMPFRSTRYIKQASALIYDDRASVLGLYLDNLLASNYMRTGEEALALELFDKCIVRARSIGYQLYIGIALHNLGCLCLKANELKQAMNYFDQAFEYFKMDDWFYLENMYFKIRCLIELKEFSQCEEILMNTKEIVNQNEKYQLLFNFLVHILSIKKESSRRYLIEIAIPHLVASNEYYKALDFCNVLENYFTKRNIGRKSLEIAAISRDIYKKIIFGSV